MLFEMLRKMASITQAIFEIAIDWRTINASALLAVSTLACGPANAGLIGASTRTDSLYSIDPTTGAATFLGPMGGNYAGVGLSYLGGELFASDLILQVPPPVWNVQTAKVDVLTGTSSLVGMQDGSLNWHGLASDEGLGVLYSIGHDQRGRPLKSMSPDGTTSTIGAGTGIDGRGMAFDDANGILYATNSDDGSLYTVDTGTGVAERVGSLGLDSDFAGLAYDEVTMTLYLNAVLEPASVDIGNLYTINLATGLASLVGSNQAPFIDGLAWIADEPSRVSEPASLTLLSIGVLVISLLGAVRRRD